ncbi:hypothetical protein EWM64_g8763 [Hericium alpestre]|uniref:Uncharacterized protein n=1 Tax=Hericium alpestre TaxID=135208 RepID=A0A4Y9ZP89_9AGAM|nr:hypothetical protein EWM64_g8763 [Hericium alpestre]
MSSGVEMLHTAAAKLSLVDGVALSQALVRSLPRVAKYLALFTVALNWRSLPFAWHVRVFAPIIAIRLRWFALRLTLLFHSKKDRKKAERQWLENLSPIGASPFDGLVTHKTWAALDDCDYNFHLSNSCYAKNLDTARLKAALAHFPGFLRAGGWIPLGAETRLDLIYPIPLYWFLDPP